MLCTEQLCLHLALFKKPKWKFQLYETMLLPGEMWKTCSVNKEQM